MHLLDDIHAYLKKTGISKSYFGKIAVGNSAVVGRLEKKRPILVSTSERLRAFMRDNPNGAPRRRDKKIPDGSDSGNEVDNSGAIPPDRQQSERISLGHAEGGAQNAGVASVERTSNQAKNSVKEEPPPDGFE